MNPSYIAKMIIVLAGIYTFMGGALDWEWFMTRPRVVRMVNMIGREKTRILYMVLGAILFALGILGIIGVIPMS